MNKSDCLLEIDTKNGHTIVYNKKMEINEKLISQNWISDLRDLGPIEQNTVINIDSEDPALIYMLTYLDTHTHSSIVGS